LASALEGELPPVLLLLDSTWNNAIWDHVDAFRINGGIVCAVLYDLIPFTHPDTVEELTLMSHTSWWSQAPNHVDAIMCISQSVRRDYLTWQGTQHFNHPLPPESVGCFYLGSEIEYTDPVVRLLTEGDPFFLMVGSLEPRKNHKTVLDAFDQLWESELRVRLAIVGAFGWKSEELLERIQNHPQLNRQLFFIRDASDRDLTSLYSKTTSLIIASLAEGFGLPIVEAYQQGARVICSDIPVFREVAGEKARYFDALNSASLAAQVVAHMQETGQAPTGAHVKIKNWISWYQSAVQLIDQVNRIGKLERP
jgi:alpha-1,2-rhamnosyltransferase